jgi:hypothetical protein
VIVQWLAEFPSVWNDELAVSCIPGHKDPDWISETGPKSLPLRSTAHWDFGRYVWMEKILTTT